MEGLSIRKAEATNSDFVFAVKKAAFREYVEQIWGWEDTYQRDLHDRRFVSQDLRIIQFCGTDVGFLSTSNTSDTLKVDQLYILPEYQGKGIGAACMGHIIDDANLEQKSVTLQVLKINTRATTFYQRLGFTIVDENATHFQMRLMSKESAKRKMCET